MKGKYSIIPAAFILIICLISGIAYAQNISYTKTMDDPDETINHMFGIAPFELFFAGNKEASTSGMLSLAGIYGLKEKIGFEANAGLPYFTVGGRKGIKYAQLGAFLNLKTKERTKETKVILGYKRTRNVFTTTETYKYLPVPSKVKTISGFRAGLQHNSSNVQTDGIKFPQASSAFNLSGIYGGLQSTSRHLIKTQLKDEKEATPTGAIYKVYADALFYPVSKIKDPILASQIKSGNIGGRLGLLWVQNPYAKKHNTSSYNAFLGRMSLSAEIGSRPIDGFYLKGGVYWGLMYR